MGKSKMIGSFGSSSLTLPLLANNVTYGGEISLVIQGELF